MSEEREHTTPSAPNPGWKETGVLALVILLIMTLGTLLVGIGANDPFRSKYASIMIVSICVGLSTCVVVLACWFIRKGGSPEHDYAKLLGLIFVLLTTILVSGIYGSSTPMEMVGAFLVVLLMFCLTFAFFIYYFDKMVRHPVIGTIEDKFSKLSDQANTSLEIANKTFMPYSLIGQGGLILGTSHEKMMERFFHEYIKDAYAIGIKFMGTTYGAFANDTASSYGFLSALESHIDACETGPPFTGELKFVCCSEAIYLLSARYLFFRLSKKLIDKEKQATFKVVYPHKECITAVLVITSEGRVPKMGLIAPSIGKTDKEFLAKNYSVGIVIKDLVSGTTTKRAGNTLERIGNYIDGFFDGGTLAETWTIEDKTLSIADMKDGMTAISSLVIEDKKVIITDTTNLKTILCEIEAKMKEIP